jgi:uncharacterized protein YqeY
MLTDEIKARMARALREKDEVVRNVLGLALGEIQTAEARGNRSLAEDEQQAIVRKLLKSNEETLSLSSGDDARAGVLRREIELLSSLLPKALSVDDVVAALAPVAEGVRAAKNDGQAMGVAMKHLKASGAVVEADAVKQAVARLRAST